MKFKYTILSLIAVVIVIIIGMSITGSSGENEIQSDQVRTLTIGSIVGLTGEYAAVGENWSNGIALAEKQWNQANPDRPVEIVQEDSEFDTQTGVTAYQKLENVNNIDALINFGTFTLNGIYESVVNKPYPVIQNGSQSTAPEDDNIVQIAPGNTPAETALGEYARQQGFQNIVAFHTDGNTFVRFMQAVENGYGESISKYALSPNEQRGFGTQVTRALSEDPDAIVLVTTPQQGASITREILRQSDGARPVILHDANFFTGFSDYKRLIGDQFAQLSDDIFTRIVQTTTSSFSQMYEDEYGQVPGTFADLGYDAFNLLVSTYAEDCEEWIDNVKAANFSGASGQVTFDEVGVRQPNFEIVTLGEDLQL